MANVVRAGGTPIRVFSDMNPELDVVIFVHDEYAENAQEILERADEDWFDENNLAAEFYPWYEWLEISLREAGINYEIFYSNDAVDSFLE